MVESGAIPPDSARSWLAPASAGAAYAVLRPASGANVFLRLIEGEAVPQYRPMRTHGWAAIEICVADVLAVAERMLQSPFEIIGPPNRIAGLPTIFPIQIRGPDLETVFLTQVISDDPASGLPQARSAIDSVFIVILACRDMRRTAKWFADKLEYEMSEPVAIRYSINSKAFALPAEMLHEIVTASSPTDIFLEFDQYPDEATQRPCHTGRLPPGTSLCTLVYPGIDRLALEWLGPPVVRGGALYGGRKVGTVLTPEGALLELIDG